MPERLDFPSEEAETLKEWKQRDTFKTSLKLSKDRKPFSFYDGPPFATGLPHYGHILAGTIKVSSQRIKYVYRIGRCQSNRSLYALEG